MAIPHVPSKAVPE
jgi:hypothetical protein